MILYVRPEKKPFHAMAATLKECRQAFENLSKILPNLALKSLSDLTAAAAWLLNSQQPRTQFHATVVPKTSK